MNIKDSLGKLFGFLGKHKEAAMLIFTHLRQEKGTSDILKELKEKTNLAEEEIELISGVIRDLQAKGFDDEVYHLEAVKELPKEKFVAYGLALHRLREKLGAEKHNNHILCMATITDKDDRLEIINKILNVCMKPDGSIDDDKLIAIVDGYGTISDPSDPFTKQMEEIEKLIEQFESGIHSALVKAKQDVEKWNDPLDKLERWIDTKLF